MQINTTRLRRVVNDIEFEGTLDFDALCEAVATSEWGQMFRLSRLSVAALIRKHKIQTKAYQPEVIGLHNLTERLFTSVKQPLCICYGMGVDSTAMLIYLARQYHASSNKNPSFRPEMITFADTGNEKEETYAYELIIQKYLKKVGFPPIVTVRYQPSEERVKHGMYFTLEQNCLANSMLPSLAYGHKGCSLKWKKGPQEKYRGQDAECRAAWAAGLHVHVAIGYDAGPKDARRADIQDDPKYHYIYPLIELGWTRERCIEEIKKEGLPVPPKSACWFCPSTRPSELIEFSETEHGRNYLRGIVRMEQNAAPYLEKIEGLWRNGTKGTRGGEARPGRMTDFILQNELLGDKPGLLPIIKQFSFEGCETCSGC